MQVWIKQNRKFGVKITAGLAKPLAKNNSILPSPILLDINQFIYFQNNSRRAIKDIVLIHHKGLFHHHPAFQ